MIEKYGARVIFSKELLSEIFNIPEGVDFTVSEAEQGRSRGVQFEFTAQRPVVFDMLKNPHAPLKLYLMMEGDPYPLVVPGDPQRP